MRLTCTARTAGTGNWDQGTGRRLPKRQGFGTAKEAKGRRRQACAQRRRCPTSPFTEGRERPWCEKIAGQGWLHPDTLWTNRAYLCILLSEFPVELYSEDGAQVLTGVHRRPQKKTAGRFCELRSVARRRCLRNSPCCGKEKSPARIGYTNSHYTALCRRGKQKNQEKTPARKQPVL